MAWLSDEQIERKMRRMLAKYGYKLHKSRKKDGGYTITGGYYSEPDTWCSDLDELIDTVEYTEERFA